MRPGQGEEGEEQKGTWRRSRHGEEEGSDSAPMALRIVSAQLPPGSSPAGEKLLDACRGSPLPAAQPKAVQESFRPRVRWDGGERNAVNGTDGLK